MVENVKVNKMLVAAILLFAAAGSVWAKKDKGGDSGTVQKAKNFAYEYVVSTDWALLERYKCNSGTAVITGLKGVDKAGVKKIIIPDTISLGSPVSTIAENAFADCPVLEEVELPETVRYIGRGAFANCTALKAINVSGKATVEGGAFANCASLPEEIVMRDPQVAEQITQEKRRAEEEAARKAEEKRVAERQAAILAEEQRIAEEIARQKAEEEAARQLEASRREAEQAAIRAEKQRQEEEIARQKAEEAAKKAAQKAELDAAWSKISYSERGTVFGLKDEYNATETKVVIPDRYEHKGGIYATPRIADNAFSGCKQLEEVVLPDTLIPTSDGPFDYAAIGKEAFKDCTALKSINIPPRVTSIEDGTFRGCTSLESIVLPEGVTSIGKKAFENCTSLKSIEIPASVEKIASDAFAGCVQLADSIGVCLSKPSDFVYGVAKGGEGVKITGTKTKFRALVSKVIIPDAIEDLPVTEIANETFKNLGLLTSVKLPKSLEKIGYGEYRQGEVFADCTSLASIELPATLKYIAHRTFEGCTALKSIVIPKGVEIIEGGTFRYCTSLESVTLSSGLKTIWGDNDVGGAFENCTALKSIVIPDSVESIGDDVFRGCISLKTINLPKSGGGIHYGAFRDCTSLEHVIIPDGIKLFTTEFDTAFSGCTSLSLKEQAALRKIGYNGSF